MGSFSLWHWLIVIIVVMVLFGGRGRVSDLMGDFAKGINSFKKGLAEDPTATPTATAQQSLPPVVPASQPHSAPTDAPRA